MKPAPPAKPSVKPPTKRLALLGVPVAVLLFSTAWAAWLAWREPALGAEVARLAGPGDVRMLSSRTCVFCDSARHWLTTHRVAFEECEIETDANCAAQFNALMAPGTPVMLVRGRPQVGFSPQRVREALAEAGSGQRTAAPKRPEHPLGG